MGTWYTLSDSEKRDFMKAGNVRRGPHQFKKKVCHWPYCDRCGLVLLKNQVSRSAASKQCEWWDD